MLDVKQIEQELNEERAKDAIRSLLREKTTWEKRILESQKVIEQIHNHIKLASEFRFDEISSSNYGEKSY